MKRVDFQKISVHETPKESPGYLLWRVSTAWRTSIEAILKPLGLTHPQFVVLASLGWLTQKGDEVTQVALGKMAGLDPNTISQILKGLEKRGLIERAPSSDGRAKKVVLTDKGSRKVAEALPVVEREDSHFFKTLSKKELRILVELLPQLTTDLT